MIKKRVFRLEISQLTTYYYNYKNESKD